MNRFFLLDQPLAVNQSVALDSICHQLGNVLRLQPGAQVGLLDNQGFLYTTEILELGRRRGLGKVLDKKAVTEEPRAKLTLYQCSLKNDKFEWVLQKGTELGVSRFVPVISERSVVRPSSAIDRKADRWCKIIQEAAEQCGRGRLPILAPALSIDQALNEAEGLKIMPWEEATLTGSYHRLRPLLTSELASTAPQSAAPEPHSIAPDDHKSDSVESDSVDSDRNQISLLIGPEGGLTQAEATAAQESAWRVTSLGPRILRAETAAIASVAIIMDTLEAA